MALIFLFLVLAAIGYLGFSIFDQLQEKQAVKERIATLPEFSVVGLDGKTVQSNKAALQVPLILTYFSTHCEFCRAEISSMKQHQALQEETNIFLVSDEPSGMLKKFASEFELDSLQSIQVFQDHSKQVKELFGVKGVPSTFVYGRNGNLLQDFQGETKAELLFSTIQKSN